MGNKYMTKMVFQLEKEKMVYLINGFDTNNHPFGIKWS